MSAIASRTPVVAAPIRVLLLVLLALGICTPVFAQTEVTGFGSNPGNLACSSKCPRDCRRTHRCGRAHGCAQSASRTREPGWQHSRALEVSIAAAAQRAEQRQQGFTGSTRRTRARQGEAFRIPTVGRTHDRRSRSARLLYIPDYGRGAMARR